MRVIQSKLMRAFWLVALVATVLGSEQAFAAKRYLTLTVGLTQEEPVPNMPAALSDDLNYNRSVVRIAIAKDLKIVRFEPLAPGTTNFTLRDDKGHRIVDFAITVRKNNLNKVAAEIQSLLGDIEGISIKIVNNKVLIDGEILLPRDMSRIYNAVAQFSDVASSIVTLSPLAQKKIAEQIERDIGNPEIHVRAVNEKFILEGVASNEAEKQKSEIIAKVYVPDVIVEAAESAGVVKKRKIDSVINLLSVKPGAEPQPSKTIKLVIHYVELQKDYSRAFKFSWSPSLSNDATQIQFSNGGGGTTGASGVVSSITGTISGLLPKLQFAKDHGHARILKSTSIIVQEGNPGIINSQTQVPYSVQNGYGQLSTQFAPVGLASTITPRLVSAKSNAVALTISFKLSTLIGTTSKGPTIDENTLQTQVTVRSNQSAAIGGLVSSDNSAAYNRLPQNGADPIITLFASKQFQRNQSQFVVFITPVIMNSASDGSDAIKKKFRLKE